MVEWGLQDKPKKEIEWGLDDAPVAVLSPEDEEKQIKSVVDLSERKQYPIATVNDNVEVYAEEDATQKKADVFVNRYVAAGMGGFSPSITRDTAIDVPVRPTKIAKEIAKGVARFAESGVGGTFGGTAYDWLGQFIEQGGYAVDWASKVGSKNKDQIHNPLAESIISTGQNISKWGKESRKAWSEQAAIGWEALDPKLKEEDPISYGAGRLSEGVASSALSVLAVYLSGGAAAPELLNKGLQINRGLVALSTMSAAGGFEHAQNQKENFLWSTAHGLADGGIEFFGETYFLKGIGKGKGALTAGFKEGGEEFFTGMLQNTRAGVLENEKKGMLAYDGAKDAIIKSLKQSPWEVAAGFIGGYGMQGGANLTEIVADWKKAVPVEAKTMTEFGGIKVSPEEPVTAPTAAATPLKEVGATITPTEGGMVRDVITSDVTQGVRFAAIDKEGNEIGAAIVNTESTPTIIEDIQVPQEQRRQGIGTAIVDAIKKEYPDVRTSLRTEEGDKFFKKVLTPTEGKAGAEVIDEETYLATHGASRQDIGEAALHKNIQEGRAKEQALKRMSEKDAALIEKREELRKEYRAKVESGEIRPPTRTEKLIDAARGMPELESTQAARRLLEKQGIDWKQPPPQAKGKRDVLGGVDPVAQINKALTDAVAIRPKVEAERKVELRKRVGAAAGALKSSLSKRKISAEEAIGRSTGLLKGPLSDARFESIRDVMEESSPGAVNEAFLSIGENEKLSYFEIVETKEAFSKLIDGIPVTLRQVDMIKKQFGIEMGEIAKARAEKSSLSDRAFALWRAGLLTGLKTSGLNTMSNLTHALTETAKDAIAAPADIVTKHFTNIGHRLLPSKFKEPGKRTVGFTVKGIPKGMREGWTKGWEYLKTGVSERDIGKKLDYEPVNFGESKLGKVKQVYVESIFHIMGAEDQPFFYGAMARSIQSQAIAQGRNEGLKGQGLRDFVEKSRKTPTQDMLENAMHDAEMSVFQNKTVLGDIARKIQKAPAIRWTVPFSRTPSAVAMQIINYTPVGTVKEVMAQIHKGEFSQRDFVHAIGRSGIGTPALAIGALLLAKGLMTLDYPDGERERKLWELEGKKPFAIKIGDKWRSAFVLGPIGNVLLIGGYFQKALTESGSPSDAIKIAMAGGGKSFTEQTFVIGMSRAIDALKDPENKADRFFTGMAGSFVPTIVADVARATDYTERTYKGPWQGVVNRVPVARMTLEERLDVFGQDLPRYGGNPLEVMIDASRPVKIRQDVVVDEIRRLWDKDVKVAPTQLGTRDGYKSLTQEENNLLWRRAGEATYQSLFELIKKRSYLRKGDAVKGKLIEREVKEAKDNARAEIARIKLNQGVTMQELKESGLVTADVEPLISRR